MDKAKKFADYYVINLELVDLDYTDKTTAMFAEMAEIYQGNQLFNVTGCNHWMLSRRLRNLGVEDKTVFAGEISDGAHNLGFSQFVSMFHPRSYEFRGYADKMAGYLFGPTFFQTLFDGAQDEDPVWRILTAQRDSSIFEPLASSREDIARQFMRSLFLRRDRMPLVKNTSPLLTPDGVALMEAETMNTTSSLIWTSLERRTTTPRCSNSTTVSIGRAGPLPRFPMPCERMICISLCRSGTRRC